MLLNASLIGAAAVTLATSYAFGDVFGARHSLHRGLMDAKVFYASFTLMVLAAAGIVLIPGAPLGLITTSVQALAGVLLPSATVFLLLLCNDTEVLGPWTNPTWLNVIAAVIIGVLVELSLVLSRPWFSEHRTSPSCSCTCRSARGVLVAGASTLGVNRGGQGVAPVAGVQGEARRPGRCRRWRCSSAQCGRPGASAAMLLLRGYLLVAVLLLIVKTVQLGH